ncbi:outer membrane beta-barrel protein [Colwellia hornerae]|uniref:Outer membrane beta-barrel protein n=1 Tax=Colwellia hornerae TaxID=89402 RepID=A0A5C6QBJ9_9GAMM|nr:outer membrane beta-barrel protein [Colwellia hornerae]TWX51097.1 outer membrane beta-barrel protein [Colwellia hornerae]TWX56773.1 outer membrane beta-barrel protein [Colwellia hornerae]TWX66017.1 outer membrane beta-barrel protein [Colwellia hornerae]
MVIFRFLVTFLISAVIALLTSFTLKAQTDFALESGNKFTATLLSEYGQISNFLNQGNDEESTGYIKIAPSIFIQTQVSRHLIQMAAKVSHYQFSQFSEDDHNDLLFQPRYFFKLDDNKTLFADIKLQESYEYRGTALSLGEAESLTSGDDKKTVAANIGYLYGQIDSVARLKLSIGQQDFRYKTRRAENKALDRVDQSVLASVDYLLSGKTYFAVDLAYTQSDFQYNRPLNKDVYAVLVGMKWQSTAITQLQALIGYQRLTFEETLFASDTRFKWRIDINWQPIRFIKMNINTERNYETTNRIADSYRIVDSTNLQITHQLTDYFQTSALVGYRQEEIVYLDKTASEEYLYSEIKLNYQRNDWLTIFAGFTFKELTASNDRLNNQGNSLSLGFSVVL